MDFEAIERSFASQLRDIVCQEALRPLDSVSDRELLLEFRRMRRRCEARQRMADRKAEGLQCPARIPQEWETTVQQEGEARIWIEAAEHWDKEGEHGMAAMCRAKADDPRGLRWRK